jgi:hypothetical protein
MGPAQTASQRASGGSEGASIVGYFFAAKYEIRDGTPGSPTGSAQLRTDGEVVTAICVVGTTDEVVVAADSMNWHDDGPATVMRKIHDLGSGIFATGYGLNGHEETNFDIPSLRALVRNDKPKDTLLRNYHS